MEHVGARAKHRAPTRYHPKNEMLGWMIILAPTFGVLIAATQEAVLCHEHGWAFFFASATLATLILYAYVARTWIKFLL